MDELTDKEYIMYFTINFHVVWSLCYLRNMVLSSAISVEYNVICKFLYR